MIDRELTLQIREKLPPDLSRIGQCYRNAWVAVQSLTELKDAFYVEGWAIGKGPGAPPYQYLEHGWIELADGRIVELTNLDFIFAHFPSYRYTRQEAKRFKAVPNFNQFWGTDRINAHGEAHQKCAAHQKELIERWKLEKSQTEMVNK